MHGGDPTTTSITHCARWLAAESRSNVEDGVRPHGLATRRETCDQADGGEGGRAGASCSSSTDLKYEEVATTR